LGLESQFVEAWTALTKHYLHHCGSLGSRLHQDQDGNWVGYAQWPSLAARDAAFAVNALPEQRALMAAAIAEQLPGFQLTSIADFLVLPSYENP
jgi:hypothetical protein